MSHAVTDDDGESEIQLSYEASEKLAEIAGRSTIDADGKTYLERMAALATRRLPGSRSAR